MLRSFKPRNTYRGLADEPFPGAATGAHLARKTVIYGRNGSGKSTFSEFLRSYSDAKAPKQRLHGNYYNAEINRIFSGEIPESVVDEVHVFNRFYVEDNLNQFLDGSGTGSPITVLGSKNLDARKAAQEHETEIRRQEFRLEWAKDQELQANAEVRKAVETVKQTVIEALAGVDGSTFNTTRFTVTKAEHLLCEPGEPPASTETLQERISVAGEPNKSPISFSAPQLNFGKVFSQLQDIISRDVVNVTNEALQGNPPLARWVEQGLTLHSEGDNCKFCGEGWLSADRLKSFTEHFNESLKSLQEDARQIIATLDHYDGILNGDSWLPESTQLLGSYRGSYSAILARWQSEAKEAMRWGKLATGVLKAVIADPLAKPAFPDSLRVLPSLAELKEIDSLLEEHDNACQSQSTRRIDALNSVQHELASAERTRYEIGRARQTRSKRLMSVISGHIEKHKEEVVSERGRMSDTGAMAAYLDRDLRVVFGHDHLRIQMSDDGKGYRITRRGAQAINLSEGERHSISLLYFLRTLERAGITPEDDLVVVDDPVTSLDREALFAAYSLLTVRLEGFGQTVLLTHDFELYRLMLMGQKSGYEKSRKKIAEGDSSEESFPAVNFLEIFAEREAMANERRSVLRALPSALLRHPSEYHYLFWCVCDALTHNSESMIPLLGNAGRRLLEGYISFKAPNGTSFQDKIDLAAELAVPTGEHMPLALAEVKERVVRFGHGMSHRAEPVPTTGLDFLAVRDELRHVLQFMQLCDPLHFARISDAVGIDVSKLGLDRAREDHHEDSMPLQVFGRIPSNSQVAYVEGVRPSFRAYGVNLGQCTASVIGDLPGAARKGFWVLAHESKGSLTAHVIRSESAGKYLRTTVLDTKWTSAIYVTGAEGAPWQGGHQHFLETSIRLAPSQYGIDTIETPPMSSLATADDAIRKICDPVLESMRFILPSLLLLLEAGNGGAPANAQ